MYKTYKTYWWLIITYVIVQFSGIVGAPLLKAVGNYRTYTPEMQNYMIISHWTIISFTTGLLIILFLLKNEINNWRQLREKRISIGSFIMWSIGGFFLALFSQAFAGLIEQNLLGINPGSENTENLVKIAKASSAFIIVTCIVGPILEELVFRKVIFGMIKERTNFIIAALLSSLIFATVHFDFQHLLVYTVMGFTFAFLYVRTKTILVPMLVHASMNSFVMYMQLNMDTFQKIMDEQTHLQQFIHWFI